jgi:crossover junction endodeoxyribonuclease RusA
MDATKLELPWPPSVNHYWRRNPRGGNYISAEGKTYLQHVALLMRQARVKPVEGPVSFKVRLHPPNRKRRDLDNSLKVLIDAVAKGGALGDDFQIKHIEASMLDVVPDGHATVTIEPLGER